MAPLARAPLPRRARAPGRGGASRSAAARARARPDRAAPPHADAAPMSRPRIALVAMTTTGAAGEYVSALGAAMMQRATTALWVPSRPAPDPALGVEGDVYVIDKPRS